MAPENVPPLVVWLGSAESRGVTGRVFEVDGGMHLRRRRLAARSRGRQGRPLGARRPRRRWSRDLLAKSEPVKVIGAR